MFREDIQPRWLWTIVPRVGPHIIIYLAPAEDYALAGYYLSPYITGVCPFDLAASPVHISDTSWRLVPHQTI